MTPSRVPWWSAVVKPPSLAIPVGLAFLVWALLLAHPIAYHHPALYTDTDLWIHLSDGRYLFEHHRIPNSSFFSFLDPPRVSPNFRWLFQALIYQLHRWGGYPALIVLRATLYLATALLVIGFLFQGHRRHPEARPWLSCLAVLYVLFLIPRFSSVRPHLFDYLFIAALLFTLEFHPRRAAWLPLLGLAWCNLHGAVYPVLLFLCGAYGGGAVFDRWRGRADPVRGSRAFLAPLTLTMATIYATPHGAQLLDAPFRSLNFLSHVVYEFMPLTAQQLTTFQVIALTPVLGTLFNCLVAAGALALLTGCVQGSLRLHHLLLYAGGLLLLQKGGRFTYECALLSLPLLRANPLRGIGLAAGRGARPVAWAMAALGLLLALRFVASTLLHRATAYPFSPTGLPRGVAAFLNGLEAGGRVLGPPNTAGYLRWELSPTYALFMDVDAMFQDEDFYAAVHLFSDRRILERMLARYDPSFILAPLGPGWSGEAMREQPGYRLVFFDDVQAVYVNERHHPALARQRELRALDPFALAAEEPEALLRREDAEAWVREAGAVLAIDPTVVAANRLVAARHLREGAFDKALQHAQAIIAHMPESPAGYVLQGDALMGLGSSERAVDAYRRGLRREGGARDAIFRKLGRAYQAQRRYAEAYQSFLRGVDVFSASGAPLDDYFALTQAALQAGRRREGLGLLTYLVRYLVPEGDAVWQERIAATLDEFRLRLEPPASGGGR
jgi:tetratricopeptide (TPR) repeat protein